MIGESSIWIKLLYINNQIVEFFEDFMPLPLVTLLIVLWIMYTDKEESKE